MPDLCRFTTDELGPMMYELRQLVKGAALDETRAYLNWAVVEMRREKESREKNAPKLCTCGDPKDVA